MVLLARQTHSIILYERFILQRTARRLQDRLSPLRLSSSLGALGSLGGRSVVLGSGLDWISSSATLVRRALHNLRSGRGGVGSSMALGRGLGSDEAVGEDLEEGLGSTDTGAWSTSSRGNSVSASSGSEALTRASGTVGGHATWAGQASILSSERLVSSARAVSATESVVSAGPCIVDHLSVRALRASSRVGRSVSRSSRWAPVARVRSLWRPGVDEAWQASSEGRIILVESGQARSASVWLRAGGETLTRWA